MRRLLLAAAAAALPSVSSAMGRMPPPRTQTFFSPDAEYKVVIKPAQKGPTQDIRPAEDGAGAPATVVEKDPKETSWATLYRRSPADGSYGPASVFKLRNAVAPIQAYLADDGRTLVTAGDWYKPQDEHALVLYALPKGELVADHGFQYLFDDPEVARTWLQGEFWLLDSTASFEGAADRAGRLRLRLFWGQTLTLRLDNGVTELAWHDPRLMPGKLTEEGTLALLKEPLTPSARRGLIRFLGDKGGPSSAQALKAMVESGERSVAYPAVSAYAKVLGGKAKPYLLDVFRTHRQPYARQAAAQALGEAVHKASAGRPQGPKPDPEVVSAFRKALASDPDPAMRRTLVGMYITYFFPHEPDTAKLFRSLAKKEKDDLVRAELLKFADQADRMYLPSVEPPVEFPLESPPDSEDVESGSN